MKRTIKKLQHGATEIALAAATTLLPTSCVHFERADEPYEYDHTYVPNSNRNAKMHHYPNDKFAQQFERMLPFMCKAVEGSEGFRADVYDCGAETQGFGTIFDENGRRVKKGDPNIDIPTARKRVKIHFEDRVYPFLQRHFRSERNDYEVVAAAIAVFATGGMIREGGGYKLSPFIRAMNDGRPFDECVKYLTTSNTINGVFSESVLGNRWYIGAIGHGCFTEKDLDIAPGAIHNAKVRNLFKSMSPDAQGRYTPKYDDATLNYFRHASGMPSSLSAPVLAAESKKNPEVAVAPQKKKPRAKKSSPYRSGQGIRDAAQILADKAEGVGEAVTESWKRFMGR